MRFQEVCPNCGGIAVDTFAFRGWELFCPSCKVGSGMFDGWVNKQFPESEIQVVKEQFVAQLRSGEYDKHPRLDSQYHSSTKPEATPPKEPKDE